MHVCVCLKIGFKYYNYLNEGIFQSCKHVFDYTYHVYLKHKVVNISIIAI